MVVKTLNGRTEIVERGLSHRAAVQFAEDCNMFARLLTRKAEHPVYNVEKDNAQ